MEPQNNKSMNTNNETFAEHLEKLARDMEYPPLNGGPTKEEIINALKAAADVIGDYETEESTNSEHADRVEELESAIEDATDKLDDILVSLRLAMKSVENMEAELMQIRSDLRRA